MGRHARVSREDVLHAARQAFRERGYEGTTLATISSRVGVSPAALLRHAPNKEALFAAAMEPKKLPLEFLSGVDPKSDPRKVLKRVALAFVPFIEEKLSEDIVQQLHLFRNGPPPFPGKVARRTLGTLADYMREATRAKRLRVKDPQAAAMIFLGSLQSYAFLHRVLRAFDPPFPLERYLDTLLEVWTRGAFQPRRPS